MSQERILKHGKHSDYIIREPRPGVAVTSEAARGFDAQTEFMEFMELRRKMYMKLMKASVVKDFVKKHFGELLDEAKEYSICTYLRFVDDILAAVEKEFCPISPIADKSIDGIKRTIEVVEIECGCEVNK